VATATRDIRLQALLLGTVVIPLGGDGVAARLSSGEVGSITRGISTSIKSTPGQREGTLTITVYPEDPAEPILRRIYNDRRAPAASSVPFPGSATVVLPRGTGNTTQTAKWSDAHFTAVPDVVLGVGTETGTYELALVDYEVTSTASAS